MASFIGNLSTESVARQLAHTLRLRNASAADVTVMSNDEWNELAGAAFGVSAGAIRVEVITTLLDAEAPALRRVADAA